MWRGIELPPIVTKAEVKEEDDMPPLITASQPPPMPPLEDCTDDDIDDDMPPLDDRHNEADDEGEPPQVEEEEDNEEEDDNEEQEEQEDCQFLHDENQSIDGELESFSQKIYNGFQSVNNFVLTLVAGIGLGFILVNAFRNRSVNNLNEL